MGRRPKPSPLDSTLSRGIIIILLFALAAIITLSFFDKAGALGIVIDQYVLSFLFGRMRYAAPIIIVIYCLFLLKNIKYAVRPTHVIGSILFLISTSSFLHLSLNPSAMWSEALVGHNGGAFGMLSWPLKTYFGDIASIIILLALILISVILILNTTIVNLFDMLAAGMQSIKASLSENIKANDNKKVNVKIHGEFGNNNEENELDDEADEEDEKIAARFENKKVSAQKTMEDDDEETSKVKVIEPEEPKPAAASPWDKKVIIKDTPPVTLLSEKKSKPTSGDINSNAQIIQDTFHEFGIDVDMGEVRVGPTVTQYSLKPNKGVKLSRITSLSNDLSLALAAHPIRIEAPIPGKSLVGIEVPNLKTAMVSIRELLESKEFETRPHPYMVALGKDVAGKVWFADLPRMPHLLIAGTTGSGKTVCVNTIILSLLYQNTAETLRMIMVDPKRVELTLYNGIPHLLTPVITNVQKTVNALKWTIGEMERRFEVLAAAGSRDIASYNSRNPDKKMPLIVFVIDELADLMASAANEIESGIIRLAQMARAVGIHLIVATQRPSVDVITGLMKANIPGRIAFSVASLIDSRTILDCQGAEKLLGRGDMLLLTSELTRPIRIQGAYVSEDELKDVVEYLKGDEEPEYDSSIVEKSSGNGMASMFGDGASDDHDPLFEDAKKSIFQAGKASASFLQRKFKIGYARAARILDELEAAGVIGAGDGAKPREILVTSIEESATMDSGAELNVYKQKDVITEIEPTPEDNEQAEIDEKTIV